MPYYTKSKSKFLQGNIALLTDNIKVALLSNGYVLNVEHEFLSQIAANEITDAGYTAGGKLLLSKLINPAGLKYQFDAADLSWTFTGTVLIKYLVIYKDTGVAGTSPLIAYFECNPVKTVIAAPLLLKWNTQGILELG